MKLILTAAALALAVTGAAQAQQKPRELSQPIVAFTPVVAKNQDALNLTEEQRADVKNWLATMPAMREAVEADTIALRADLRDAIKAGAPVDQRQAIADKIGANEAKMVMMRSNCTDHWRAVLTADQFAQMLDIAAKM